MRQHLKIVVAIGGILVLIGLGVLLRYESLRISGPKLAGCVSPSGEKSRFLQWDNGLDRDVAEFRGILKHGKNFVGQEVTERPRGSGTGSIDTCFFRDSIIREYTNQTAIEGFTWRVGPGGVYGEDYVGVSANLDEYYHLKSQTPCELATTQHMKIVCPDSSLVEYCSNRLRILVGNSGTVVSRAGVAATPPHFVRSLR